MKDLLIPLKTSEYWLRTWTSKDAETFMKYVNNRAIWLNMRDEFPYPCTRQDADRLIAQANSNDNVIYLAIANEWEAVGSISLQIHDDIRRYSGVLSYWVGQPYWGQGLATAAIEIISDYALSKLGLVRVYAKVFSTNIGSIRALEKSGFEREGYFRKGVFKEGQFIDQTLYAKVV